MVRLYLRAEEQYQASKLREGLLDFDDLEIYAYRLLQNAESPDILYWLDRKILHFLVDEFQDTNDIQWAILDKLTGELFAGQGADKRMAPTLFVVGDKKQSIYRFREANYRLIENVKQKMETLLPPESRAILTLDRNFRSTPEIIEIVNKVFAGLWGEGYQSADVDRKKHKGSVQLIELQPLSEEVVRPGQTEAAVLAQRIRWFVETGVIVYEKIDIDWKERHATYGDCAILIQSRAKLKEYETALQQVGIPYRVLGGIGFYEEDEIQAVMNTLYFLWNRDDRLALAASLTSSLFGLTDREIFNLMQQTGDMLGSLRTLRPDVWKLLHQWQMNAGVAPLAVLLHTIINESGAYVRFGRNNPQAVFNLDKLLDTAREFDCRGYTTLQDFVEWVRNLRRTEQREATADMNLPGSRGFVSIMTVHKAKGLEYPVVFLPGMNQAARSLTIGPRALISETDGVKRIAIKDSDNPVYDDLWKGDCGEQEELKWEHQRLLYVAMTRARDHLIMLGTLGTTKNPVKQNTWLDYIHTMAPQPLFEAPIEDPAGTHVYSFPGLSGESNVTAASREKPHPKFAKEDNDKGESGVSEKIDVQTILENIAPFPRSEALQWKSATDFIKKTGGPAIESLPAPFEARTVSPVTRGNVLHRCLEEYTKNGEYDLDSILGEHTEILMLGKDALLNFKGGIISVLDRVLNDTGLAWVFARHANAYTELPFLYRKGDSLISGVMDRVVIQDGSGIVIDYKAIIVENDEALSSWKKHYKPQIAIYCEAMKETFRLEHVAGYLLFLDSSRLDRVM
jgi:ATP-dependent helicase/nuclease subunit A